MNTIGPKQTSSACGQPFVVWDVLDASGRNVGVIEAIYEETTRGLGDRRRYGVTAYELRLDAGDLDRLFRVRAFGSAAAALAAAKRIACRVS